MDRYSGFNVILYLQNMTKLIQNVTFSQIFGISSFLSYSYKILHICLHNMTILVHNITKFLHNVTDGFKNSYIVLQKSYIVLQKTDKI